MAKLVSKKSGPLPGEYTVVSPEEGEKTKDGTAAVVVVVREDHDTHARLAFSAEEGVSVVTE